MSARPSPRGFSLIEVLVALTVLAVGLMGVAKLFVVTIQGNASATSRLYAVNLGADLADRIRANRTGGAAYAGAPTNYSCAGGALRATLCTPTQMAANDLYLWKSQISTLMPAGATGTVTYAAGNTNLPSTYTITLAWKEAGTGQALSYAVRVVI
jgi:type IV pilus assembly protein PilV